MSNLFAGRGITITLFLGAGTPIAASSRQQLAGMDQIDLAMKQIKTAMEQNVESTDGSKSTARNLHEIGERLRQLVG
jgi:methyl-accepting chemotaxis protein